MLTYQIIENFTGETVGTVEVSEPHKGRHPIQEDFSLIVKGPPRPQDAEVADRQDHGP